MKICFFEVVLQHLHEEDSYKVLILHEDESLCDEQQPEDT
jgi:hypothetical protein